MLRSVLFAVILIAVGLFASLYLVLSLPSVQQRILGIACSEVSRLLGGRVDASEISIKLFDEIVLHDVSLTSPAGDRCIEIRTLGAGIDLGRLVWDRKIEVTYAEILGLKGHVTQSEEGGPLNIQFMIDALAPKDKSKPPTAFDLNIRTVVIRDGDLEYGRLWCPPEADSLRMDFNHIHVKGLSVDMSIPKLRNDDFEFHLRRLAFVTSSGLDVRRLGCIAEVSPRRLAVRGLHVDLPRTSLRVGDLEICPEGGYAGIKDALYKGTYRLDVTGSPVVPSDFGALLPVLRGLDIPLRLAVEAEGNLGHVMLRRLSLTDSPDDTPGPGLNLQMTASVTSPASPGGMSGRLERLDLGVSGDFARRVMTALEKSGVARVGRGIYRICDSAGRLRLDTRGVIDLHEGTASGELYVSTAQGSVTVSDINIHGLNHPRHLALSGTAASERLNLGALTGSAALGEASFLIDAAVRTGGRIPDGTVDAMIGYIDLRGYRLSDVALYIEKEGSEAEMELSVSDRNLGLDLAGALTLAGAASELDMNLDLFRFTPGDFNILPQYPGYQLTGHLDASLRGDSPDNVDGTLSARDVMFTGPSGGALVLRHLEVSADTDDIRREISVDSDLLEGHVSGQFRFRDIVPSLRRLASAVMPSLISSDEGDMPDTDLGFEFKVKPDDRVLDFMTLPLRPLTDIDISGSVNSRDGVAEMDISVPYLLQGKNKLVRDTRLRASVDRSSRAASVTASTVWPVKFGELNTVVHATANEDIVLTTLQWSLPEADRMSGSISLGADFQRSPLDRGLSVALNIEPSEFVMNNARWHIGGGRIRYGGKHLEVEDFRVSHGSQFVAVEGVASQYPEDRLSVSLADIDLGYIFDTLNINYVTFGGTATGELEAAALFSGIPEASTRRLSVKDLSYNGTVLGDGELKSSLDAVSKRISILADITGGGRRRALVDGGIWLGRDSLSFDIDADHVNVGFLRPFMAAFCSGAEGEASGHAKLFGTFSDIDLTGRIHADTLRMKLDFTNTWYGGSDSVILNRGHIVIPSFRLYDRDGHSGVFSGELRHRYFHDPEFDFRLRDAHDLLCYDTNAQLNPDWYGTVYGTGGATITGRPGTVGINIDMTTCPRSTFTMVLNDTQAAEDYRFLTFSDRRREEADAAMPDSVPAFLKRYRKNVARMEDIPTNVVLDVRATVNNGALMTLVMDPAGGDKITARGHGALQMEYESESNEMKMFGRYTLEEGNYNFSLQDIILRDFTIRPGSAIAFNGDPMDANLDIAATYRVNTNISDLDKSFLNDRDLNRTNVPVDAVLMVQGPMTAPDISFDIDLPTLTEEAGRKVRSLISTNDMMSRQIIYLLALNRFYTPEYTGSSSNGGEFTSIASTTLSSQLSNVLSQLTDKLTVSPSIRSDKGDFSDIEMDLALSSRLLNNRLLINGNFGYRDRSTSSTTFVGDFDIEYLLTRNGNLRLKAYNHFNDQNYYLRSALTTQGIGVVVRHEFDRLWPFNRRKSTPVPSDSVTGTAPAAGTVKSEEKETNHEEDTED